MLFRANVRPEAIVALVYALGVGPRGRGRVKPARGSGFGLIA